MIEQFIGPEIAGHPIFAIRSKIPTTRLLTVPWHQDCAYLLPEAEATDQVTCWIPFEDVNVQNGCMQYLRGAHRARKLFRHHLEGKVGSRSSPYLYIRDEDLPDCEIATCEMKLGSVIFHMQHSPHRSLENHSDRIRWSVDFRYQRPGMPTGLEGDDWVLLDMRRGGNRSFRPDLAGWLVDARRKRRADYFEQSGVDEFDIDAGGTDKTMQRWVDPAA
jgi:ectoine hydroxylase-related dioxygenase (phytanoyl-CoA dioxygenase family)